MGLNSGRFPARVVLCPGAASGASDASSALGALGLAASLFPAWRGPEALPREGWALGRACQVSPRAPGCLLCPWLLLGSWRGVSTPPHGACLPALDPQGCGCLGVNSRNCADGLFSAFLGPGLSPPTSRMINEGSAARELASVSQNLLSALAAPSIPEQGLALCSWVVTGPG